MTDIPMPEDRYREVLARRESLETGALPEIVAPDRELPPVESTAFARALLAEAQDRLLESGELLVLFEEAALGDLQVAAGPIPVGVPWPAIVAPAELAALPELPSELTEPLAAGAWLLADRVRRLLGHQASAAGWMRAAHQLMAGGLRIAADMVIGHIETWPERVEHLARLRALHERDRGIVEVAIRWCRGPEELPAEPAALRDLVPWPTELQAPDLARTLALARLTLPREIAVIAVGE